MIGVAMLLLLPFAHAWELPIQTAQLPTDAVGGPVFARYDSDRASVEVYDIATGSRVATRPFAYFQGLVITPDGRSVVVATGEHFIHWRLADDHVTFLPVAEERDPYDGQALISFGGAPALYAAPDDRVLAATGAWSSGRIIGPVTLMEWVGDSPKPPIELEADNYASPVGVAWFGDVIEIAWSNGQLASVRGGEATWRKAPLPELSAMAVSPDGTRIAWGGPFDQLLVTDIAGKELFRSPRAPVAANGSSDDPAVTHLIWEAGGTRLTARWVDATMRNIFGAEALDFNWVLASGQTTDRDTNSEASLPGVVHPDRCRAWKATADGIVRVCAKEWILDPKRETLLLTPLAERGAHFVKNDLVSPSGAAVRMPVIPTGVERTTQLAVEDSPDGRFFSNRYEDVASDDTKSAYLLVWSASGGDPILRIPVEPGGWNTAWARDRLVAGAGEYTKVFAIPSGRTVLSLKGTLSSEFRADNWSVVGDLLIGCTPGEDARDCAAYQLKDGARIAALSAVPLSLPTVTNPPRFVGQTADGGVCVEEVGRGCLATFPRPADDVDEWVISPDGAWLLRRHRLADEAFHNTLYDAVTGAERGQVDAGREVGSLGDGVLAIGGPDILVLIRKDGARMRLAAVEADGVPHLVGIADSGAVFGDPVSLARVFRGAPGALEHYTGRAPAHVLRDFLSGR